MTHTICVAINGSAEYTYASQALLLNPYTIGVIAQSSIEKNAVKNTENRTMKKNLTLVILWPNLFPNHPKNRANNG